MKRQVALPHHNLSSAVISIPLTLIIKCLGQFGLQLTYFQLLTNFIIFANATPVSSVLSFLPYLLDYVAFVERLNHFDVEQFRKSEFGSSILGLTSLPSFFLYQWTHLSLSNTTVRLFNMDSRSIASP